MCGITGHIGSEISISRETLENMNEVIHHRGPDEDGFFQEAGVSLAMRRLSIVDLHGGTQPIFNEDKTVCVVFNGEIYNYDELRSTLESLGHSFATNSDTEVIVHLYEEHGPSFVEYLRGMFAIALWDRESRRAILARDRIGIKPLFYSVVENDILFGSEMKCITATGLVDKKVNLQALDAYMTFGYIPAPLTIFEDIHKLPPGHLLLIEGGSWKIEEYWDLDFTDKADMLEVDWQNKLEEELRHVTEIHLMSDVPLGAFLSGGIDSSLVVAMMAGLTKDRVQTFTMGFGGQSTAVSDERPYARLVSERYQTEFNDFTVSPDFQEIAEELVSAFDEPFSDDSIIPSYYISKLTREKVKVALSGLGGDELFGGYHRYFGFKLSQYYKYIPDFIHRHLLKPIANKMPEPRTGNDKINHIKRFINYADLPAAERYLAYVSAADITERQQMYQPDILEKIEFSKTSDVIVDKFNGAKAESDLDRMFYVDMKTYLPDDILALSDRLSMHHSLELRVPFVDHKLIELTCMMPAKLKIKWKNKKYILKKIAEKYLPRQVITHRKQGFESPMASWLKNDLKTYTNEILSKENVEKAGFFEYDYVLRKLEEHYSNREKNNKIIFSLIMFHLWAQHEGIRYSSR